MREFGWFELAPGKGKWFYGEASDIYGRSMKDPRAIPGSLEFTFLEGQYKGKKYRSKHFFPVPQYENWKMQIYPHNTGGKKYEGLPGVRLLEPWIAHKSWPVWPATPFATSIATREHS